MKGLKVINIIAWKELYVLKRIDILYNFDS